jgi:hypothetical protein
MRRAVQESAHIGVSFAWLFGVSPPRAEPQHEMTTSRTYLDPLLEEYADKIKISKQLTGLYPSHEGGGGRAGRRARMVSTVPSSSCL